MRHLAVAMSRIRIVRHRPVNDISLCYNQAPNIAQCLVLPSLLLSSFVIITSLAINRLFRVLLSSSLVQFPVLISAVTFLRARHFLSFVNLINTAS